MAAMPPVRLRTFTCEKPACSIIFLRAAPVQQAGNVTLLQGPQDCVPCGRAGCEDHHHSRSDCLQSIAPERVLQQALRLLAGVTLNPDDPMPAA